MIIRNLLFSVFLLVSFSTFGQTTEQDTAYWEAFDAAMVDRIWDGIEAETGEEPTYRELFDSLKIELATRLRNGPVTTSLAYRYHWISLRLKGRFLAEVKPYADTAIMLRIQAGAPTADIAQSHYEKARVLALLGNDQESLRFFEEGIRIMSQAFVELDSIPDLVRRQAYFMKESAFSAGRNGNYELARLRLDQISLLRNMDSSGVTQQTAFESELTRASVEGLAGKYIKSIDLYRQALGMDYLKNAVELKQAPARMNLGRRLFWVGRYDEAERELYTAVSLYENTEDWLNLASGYINIMDLRVRQRRPQEALNLLDISESTAQKANGSGKGGVFGELYLYAAQASEQLGLTQQTEELLEKAAAVLLSNPQLTGPAKLPRIEGNTIYGQPVLLQFLSSRRDFFLNAFKRDDKLEDLLLAHDTSKSIDTLMRLNRDQLNLTASLGQFISKEAEQYTTAVDVALQLYRNTDNSQYLNEAYQFVASQKSNLLRRYLTSPELASTLGVSDEVVEEKKGLDLQILIVEKALQNANNNEEAVLRDSLLRLNFQVSRLKDQITRDYPIFSKALRGFAAIDPQAVAATLETDQLVVEYFLASDSIYLFTLSRQDGLRYLTVPRPKNLTELIETVVDQGAGATELFELLVAPVIENRPNITRLQFIPDGDLWKLPFAALKKGEDFLINNYAISFAYASALLFDEELALQARARELEYLGYGISYESLQQNLTSGLRSADYRDLREMGQLPFASKEVQRAAELIGGTLRLNEEASLTKFLGEAAGAKIIHLSMHGLLRPNPMESALVFMNEGKEEFALLEMKDVLGGNYPAELTVLSACHTGGGNLQTSEGMQSIGRAFTAAGSKSTITSTWAAQDESTHDILGGFFEELKTGTPKDIALQRAINNYLLAGTPADRQPVNWANLTLTGIVTPVSEEVPWLLFVVLGAVAFTVLYFILPTVWRRLV